MPRLRRRDFERAWIQSHGGTLKSFLLESDGFEGIEYSVMTALIVGAVVAVLTLMALAMNDAFVNIASIIFI